MKKLILALLFVTCLSFQASALGPMMLLSGSSAEQSSCPSYYASAIFSWNGDHTLGHNYACTQDGTPVLADADTATTHTDYGEDGSVGILIDDVTQSLSWDQTVDQYIDDDAAQTICLRIKISGVLTANPKIFNSDNGSDVIAMDIEATTGTVDGYYYVTTGVDVGAKGNIPTADGTTWVDVAYSWSPNGPPMQDGDHSANPGDGVWASTWEEDAGELDDDQTNDLDNIAIGNPTAENPGAGEYIYITDFAIVSGYQQACPWQ